MNNTTPLTAGQHKYYGKINERLNRLKGEILNIFTTAAKDKQSHDCILKAITDRVYNHKEFYRGKRQEVTTINKLPRPYRNEINGYIDACFALHRQNLEWILYYDSKYIGNSKRNKKATDRMYKMKNFDTSKVTGHHAYIKTEIWY